MNDVSIQITYKLDTNYSYKNITMSRDTSLWTVPIYTSVSWSQKQQQYVWDGPPKAA